VRGVGNGAPKPNVPDQVDPTGPRSRNGAGRLSTRSPSTPRLLDLALRTVMSMSSVWTTAGPRSAERGPFWRNRATDAGSTFPAPIGKITKPV
jgi:hypothetical protein